jgi:seryl-tRNA synthetase
MSSNHTAQVEQLGKKLNITQQVVSIGITIVTTMVVVYGFFYNMSKTIEVHTSQLKELQDEINEMRKTTEANEVYKGVSATEMKAVQDKVSSIEAKVDRMDEKLDRILMRK